MFLKFHSRVIAALLLVKVAQWRLSLGAIPGAPPGMVSAITYTLPLMVLLTAILFARDKFTPAPCIQLIRRQRPNRIEKKIVCTLLVWIGVFVMLCILSAIYAPERMLLLIQSNYAVGLEKHQVALAWREHWAHGLQAYCTILVIAPVLEELYFRGLLLNHWAQTQRLATAVAGSTVIFVAAHLHFSAEFNWAVMVHLGAGAMLYCYAYVNLGLKAAIVIHAVVNAWSSTLILMAKIAQWMVAA